jgi:hypothetical protein
VSKQSKSSGEKPNQRQKELAKLIRDAVKQPGIQQLMDVYQHWKPYEAVARAHQQFLGIQRVVVVSNSSGGVVARSK